MADYMRVSRFAANVENRPAAGLPGRMTTFFEVLSPVSVNIGSSGGFAVAPIGMAPRFSNPDTGQ
jgi:hypothetical protein